MSELEVRIIPSLPSLAWIARVKNSRARVQCGEAVTAHGYVFEGAWSDVDGARTPLEAAEVFGSGLCYKGDAWRAVPPSHLLEGLYVLQADEWIVSNSLALLQAETGFEFSIAGPALLAALSAAAASIRARPVTVPTTRGVLHLCYHHNARLGATLESEPKLAAAAFTSFEHYRTYLKRTLSAVRGQTRREFVVAVSRGYDSVASAALVSSLGGGCSISFRSARDGGDDNGAPLARALGLGTVELDRPERVSFAEAAPFLSSGLGGEDALYAAAAAHLDGRIFVTGFHGDKIWELGAAANVDLKRGDVSGASLGEFRLRRNFVHVPTPFIGGRRHPYIAAISRSAALRPYRVGGDYDRPIARRLAEEAGLQRNAFGMSKRAVSLTAIRETAVNAPLPVRARFWAGVAAWRVLHGGGRRLGPLRTPALAFADSLFPRLFGSAFAVFEHTHPGAETPFRAALAALDGEYRGAMAEPPVVIAEAHAS